MYYDKSPHNLSLASLVHEGMGWGGGEGVLIHMDTLYTFFGSNLLNLLK